ncbi:MAG: hypothetical protein KUG78_01890 [Kangiellaceae bacterium]|nr:hypothetical protein [Kangiellaceae bacterium]
MKLIRAIKPIQLLVSLLVATNLLTMNAIAEETPKPATIHNGQIKISDKTFSCIREMTKVRGFYVDNLLGDIEGTLKTAQSENGGTYPPGSLVQLVPGEVMVKHHKGFNAATKDWEFFELDATKDGSKIRKRGFADVVNRFGGNCFGCHIKAKPQWDMICETGHGCDPIPLTKDILALLQKTDPRCKNNEALTEVEIKKLAYLKKVLSATKPDAQ